MGIGFNFAQHHFLNIEQGILNDKVKQSIALHIRYSLFDILRFSFKSGRNQNHPPRMVETTGYTAKPLSGFMKVKTAISPTLP